MKIRKTSSIVMFPRVNTPGYGYRPTTAEAEVGGSCGSSLIEPKEGLFDSESFSPAHLCNNTPLNNTGLTGPHVHSHVIAKDSHVLNDEGSCVSMRTTHSCVDSTLKSSAPNAELNEESTFAPQAGFTIDTVNKFVEELSKSSNTLVPDEVMTEIECATALFLNLQSCADYVGMTSALFLYFKRFHKGSVLKDIMNYVNDIFDVEPQNGLEVVDTKKNNEWLDFIKSIRDNWALVRNNKLFAHFSKLLGLVVTLNICEATSVTFTVKDYKIWEPDMKVVHGSAMDVADAALSTVTFFIETISLCCEQGSLKPLLLNETSAIELDEEYANVVLWWGLVKNGNLKKVANKEDSEFDRRLEVLTTKIKALVDTKASFERKLIQDKYMKLLAIKNDYVTMKISTGVRKAPFCIELFGGSAQGKTTLGDQCVDALLTSQDMSTDRIYRANYNPSDNFMSSYRTCKTVLTIDDVCNDKSTHISTPPTRIIIDACNNQAAYANMPDLESKGKVFIEPDIVMVTTNMKNLDAATYSNCPYSIQRRMHAVITVNAKPEFQYIVDGKPQGIDATKVQKHYADLGIEPVFDDIWSLTVEKAVQPSKLTLIAGYKPVSYRGQPLVNAPFRLVMQYLVEEFDSHKKSQQCIINRVQTRREIDKCPFEGCRHLKGFCDAHDNLVVEESETETPETEEQFGEEIVDSISEATTIVTDKVKSDFLGVGTAVEGACTIALISAAKHFASRWDWIKLIPTPWLTDVRVRNCIDYIQQDNIDYMYKMYTRALWAFLCIFIIFGYSLPCEYWFSYILFIFIIGVIVQRHMVEIVSRDFSRRLVERNSIAPCLQQLRDDHVTKICTAFTFVGALYTVSRLYRIWKGNRTQGSLEPKTKEEVKARDAETNVWTEVHPRSLPIMGESETTTSDQLDGLVRKNLVYGSVKTDKGTLMVNGLFVKSNVVIVPDHYFVQDVLSVVFRKEQPDKAGGKFNVNLSKAHSYLIPNTDIRICYASAGGSFKDLTKYFSPQELPLHEFKMLWRNIEGVMMEAEGLAEPKDTSNGVVSFRGYSYATLNRDTFKGLCGAVLFSKKKAIITGIHVGGKTGTPRGCSAKITRSELEVAYEELRKIEGVLLTGTAENFEAQVLGVKIITGQPLHPKSPLNYMPLDSQVEYYGSCKGMTTFKSDAKPTKISEVVTEVLGVPNKYRPPVESPQYFGWQKCLSNLANPAKPFDPNLLDIAIKDYKEDLIEVFRSDLWRDARPLTKEENLNGIPGMKFTDAIKLNTSIGFPLSGKKSEFVQEITLDDGKTQRVFDQVIMDEITRCQECYKLGQRAYPIAKACKKDEILSKEKCRIFYGNAIALTWEIRRCFLPILRVLQMNPLISECAVGVNSHGPEWGELTNHINTFGDDRLFGGDYGKYDQKLPSQLILAAFRILIDFAKECDYSDEDIRAMEALAGDVVFAIIAFNGDLIGLTEGTHISGNSLTVIINGICGSLNLRCYFYNQNPCDSFDNRLPFREHVKLMTYGDDNIGSVSPSINNFTIKGASEFLGSYGQTYTMPDKESELLDFLPSDQWEFLKRKSVYHEQLGTCVGALTDDSCIKMLMYYLRPKGSPLTEEHACALNLETALREWFNHGREVFEMRQQQMIEIAEKANISHLCPHIQASYDERVHDWKVKYTDIEYTPFTEEIPEDFETQ